MFAFMNSYRYHHRHLGHRSEARGIPNASPYSWRMGLSPKSQQPSALQRLPVVTGQSSSASLLYGMEQAVPSFQSFLKRTPPLNQHKPLPPTPRKLQRMASLDSATSSRASSIFVRSQRSHSVHSRTIHPQDLESCIPHTPAFPSRHISDSTDRFDAPLRPMAYSASTSQLVPTQTYNPVVNRPSPTVSKRTTPSPDPEPRPSILLPSSPPVADIPQQHLRTVSLEKAKQAMHAPGAMHLLPEELRARGLSNSLDLPRAPTLDDSQVRGRLIAAAPSTFTGSPCLMTTSSQKALPTALRLERQPVKAIASVAPRTYEESGNKAAKLLGLEEGDNSRSHYGTRGSLSLPYERRPKMNRISDASNLSSTLQSDAHGIIQEYHAIVSEHDRQPSTSLALDASEDPESTGEGTVQMQMMPQPLFYKWPTAQVPGIVSTGVLDSERCFISPEHTHVDRDVIESLNGLPSSRLDSVPLELSQDARGSISLCPPSIAIPRKIRALLRHDPNEQTKKTIPKDKRNDEDYRISHFYPHVMPRRTKGSGQRNKGKGKSRKHSATSQKALSLPTIAIDNTAEQLKTPDGNPDASFLRDNSAQTAVRSHGNTDSSFAQLRGSSDELQHEQIFDKLESRCALVCEPRKENRAVESRVSPKPQPFRSRALSANSGTAVHFRCSDLVKRAFNKVLSIAPPPKGHAVPTTTHSVGPGRPSEASPPAPLGSDGPAMRSSPFGAFTTHWRMSKAEKKRQNLKKLIKIVHSERQGNEQTGAVRFNPVVRRLSLPQRI